MKFPCHRLKQQWTKAFSLVRHIKTTTHVVIRSFNPHILFFENKLAGITQIQSSSPFRF